jgi:hypothetical protein
MKLHRFAPGRHAVVWRQAADGSLVYGPTVAEKPEFGVVTAICRDQRASHAHQRRGACARHHGLSVLVGHYNTNSWLTNALQIQLEEGVVPQSMSR